MMLSEPGDQPSCSLLDFAGSGAGGFGADHRHDVGFAEGFCEFDVDVVRAAAEEEVAFAAFRLEGSLHVVPDRFGAVVPDDFAGRFAVGAGEGELVVGDEAGEVDRLSLVAARGPGDGNRVARGIETFDVTLVGIAPAKDVDVARRFVDCDGPRLAGGLEFECRFERVIVRGHRRAGRDHEERHGGERSERDRDVPAPIGSSGCGRTTAVGGHGNHRAEEGASEHRPPAGGTFGRTRERRFPVSHSLSPL